MTLRNTLSPAWLTVSTIALTRLLCAQPPAEDRDKALESLKRLVTDENFRDLGFDARGDVAGATLNVPFRRYFVTGTELRAFKDQDNPMSVIRDSGEWLFPVRAGNNVRCFITMADRGNGWRGVAFGQAEIAQGLTSMRAERSAANNLPAASFFAVDMTPFGSYLLGWRSDGRLPGDPGNTDFLLLPVPINNKRLPGPSGSQRAPQLLKTYRDELRKHQPGAP
jgi:hypothetical protein